MKFSDDMKLTKDQAAMAQRRLNALAAGAATGESAQETRRSWALGEIMLAHPEMPREQAVRIVDEAIAKLNLAKGKQS